MDEKWKAVIELMADALTWMGPLVGDSHNAAMAEDRLNEALFWATRACVTAVSK